ncbi:hypothetical protein Dsin_023838 [Dipteronia sinensis]|uniref:Uncharacterized protein n=1 Tax=Dipteronia sinensis TaxID=43782 RepID=A0AAE0E157_9ROSI|nr:hypothetical protein Dsin_023838 [Dipteronia sinensis]
MICKCSVLEEITVKEVREEERKDQMFPKLMYLPIQDLENLTRFCSGSYIELPSLKVLHIDRCPELKTFISEDTSTTTTTGKEVEKMRQAETRHIGMQPFLSERVNYFKSSLCFCASFLVVQALRSSRIYLMFSSLDVSYFQLFSIA